MEIVSFAQFGYEGAIVKVEADLRRGIPSVAIVGLPDGAVREARDRMRAAIVNSGFDFPRERILINLSPAGLKKEGSAFDLPIALAVLHAAESAAGAAMTEAGIHAPSVMVLGELELSGIVRPVRGILPAVTGGIDNGVRLFIVPESNRAEAEIIAGARIMGVSTLAEAALRLRALSSGEIDGPTPGREPPPREMTREIVWSPIPDNGRYEDVKGQPRLVRALEIAAAGGHHLIAYGPPGCGKTLALRRFPSLLPDLDTETAIEVTRIQGIAGARERDDEGSALASRPPFREPHQGASLEGMTGGGRNCRPGEISLAHGGVLFLDEAALFRASVLQALRTPLETGFVTVSRALKSGTFPARFQLLLAVNPCPCGNFGAKDKVCTCLPESIDRYWKRLTAPLLDRIDLRVRVDEPDPAAITGQAGTRTEDMRARIARARRAQIDRSGDDHRLNAVIDSGLLESMCETETSARKLLEGYARQRGISGRGTHGILRTARTIADLAGETLISERHVREAIEFRSWDGLMPDFLLGS